VCFIGEGGTVDFDVSASLIHPQKTVYGSWVTSISKMEQLVERIVQWRIHPSDLITKKFLLKDTDKAYKEMATGTSGKVAVVFDEELRKLSYASIS
jgi:threonine dehydrogenase-like Zn-dependent dehydrogenase